MPLERSRRRLVYLPLDISLDVASVQLHPHARVAGLDNNNLHVSGSDWVERVEDRCEMVTVSGEDLATKKTKGEAVTS